MTSRSPEEVEADFFQLPSLLRNVQARLGEVRGGTRVVIMEFGAVQSLKRANLREYLLAKVGLRDSRERAPTSLLYGLGSRALIWDRFCP